MSDAVTSPYEPLKQYKPFAPNIGIVDGPFEYVWLLRMKMPWPFTTRMTVVRLANGDLFLHSPIAFDAALAAQLRSFGAGAPTSFRPIEGIMRISGNGREHSRRR